MHDMSKETFLRPDQLKRGVEIELTQRPEWGTAFIRGRVQGKPQLWDISKSMDKRGIFVSEDELLQHWRTPNMSNTRKEIAARLGFAAGNGAKVSFERYEIGDAFKFEDKIYVINSHANEINAVLSSADSNAKKALSLADFAHSKWLQFEGKAKASRPGAKSSFDNKQIAQGLSRLLKETGFDGMASDVLSGSSDSETLRKYVRVLKGKMSPLSGDAKSAELLSKLEKMLSARAGEKTRMTREQTEEQKAGLKIMSAADPAVGAKIATLIKEGKPQDQAVAIALDMKRRGEL